jgi:predicted MFS family arabinose efflux permease
VTTTYDELRADERADNERAAAGDGRLLAAICFAALVGFLLASALSPFFPLIADDLGTSVALLGQIPALSMLVAAVLGLLIGPLADQYGYRRLLILGSIVVVGSAVSTALAPTFGLLLLATLLAAVSRAIIQPVALAVAGANFTGAAQRRAMSWVVAAIAGAPIAGVPALTAIGGTWGWRAAFAALALAALVALGLVMRELPADRAAAQERPSPRGVLASYPVLLRHAPTMSMILSSFLRSSAAWGWFTYYSAYLVQARQLTIPQAGWAYTGVGLGLFAGSLLAGGRIARLPAPPLLATTAILQGLLLCTPVLLSLNVPIVIGAMSLGR